MERNASKPASERREIGPDAGAIAVGNPSAEFDAFVRAEITAWGKLIREMKL